METINTNENKGRGMILFIHNTLPFQAHHFEVDFNKALFSTLKLKGKETLLVGSFYRSPNSTTENNDNLNELLEKISEKMSHVLLFGDFNYPKIDWKVMCTVPSIEDKEFKFIEKLRGCYFIQHISEPTRGRGTTEPSLLDLVITSEDSEIVLIETVSALGKSDHSTIKVILNCTPIHEPIIKTVYKYDKGDYPKMGDMLSIDWDVEFSKHKGDVQAQWDIFTMEIREAVERCIPKKVMSERTTKTSTTKCKNTPEEPIRCYNTVETCTINPSIVASKLKKLTIFKSPGSDGVHPRVINELADCISIPLLTIFNTSLTTGKLPI